MAGNRNLDSSPLVSRMMSCLCKLLWNKCVLYNGSEKLYERQTMHIWTAHERTNFNPFLPKCVIWHKKQLRAQYLVNLCEICTTRRSWKDLQIKGIKSCPLLYQTSFTTLQTFGNFSLCTLRVQLISYSKQCTESCKLSSSLGVNPICTKGKKIFNVFLFPFWTLLTLTSHLHPC